MENKTLILLVVVLGIGIVIGYGWGYSMTLSEEGPEKSESQIRKEAKRDLVKTMRNKGFLSPEPEEINEVQGEVKKVGENQLVLDPRLNFDDPLGEFFPETVTVKVGEETKIIKREEKSMEQLEQEEEEFNEQLDYYERTGEEMPEDLTPPEPFTETEISLSEIEQGTEVQVTSEENIKNKSEFVAETISFEEELEE